MARILPLEPNKCNDFETVFEITEAIMGFIPNSMLIMARDPGLFSAFAQLSAVVVARPSRIDQGLKSLIMYIVSRSAGCQYCTAHCANLAALRGVPARRVQEAWHYETSPEFNESERAALRFARAAAEVPNAVSDVHFTALRRYFDDDQIIEIVATIAFMAFLNRWNDTLATPLEGVPRDFAERHLKATGWNLGKHSGGTRVVLPERRSVPLRTRLFLWLLRRWAPKVGRVESTASQSAVSRRQDSLGF
jgi:uncharacterized peroxidase-related enzyme